MLDAVTVFVLTSVACADTVVELLEAPLPQPASASVITPTMTTTGAAFRCFILPLKEMPPTEARPAPV